MDKSLRFLNSVKHNLELVDYSLIYQSICDLRDKPVTTALLFQGHFIDRVRINNTDEIFTCQEEISYIHNPKVIEKLDFGRANEKKQAVFYGSMVSPEIELPRAVAYLETTKKLHNGVLEEEFEEVFTLSRWRLLKTIQVAEIAFSKDALANSSYCRSALENQLKNIPRNDLYDHYMDQLIFFSDEFAKQKINLPADYKISAAYANYIWRNTPYSGMTYASVPTDYKGQNVCLLPEVVNKYLKLEKVAMFRAIKKRNNSLFIGDAFKYCDEFGDNAMNFRWKDFQNGIIL